MNIIKNLVNIVTNIIVPPLALAMLLLVLPPYLLIKLIVFYIVRPVLTEDVAGKVILITGASSGIGERIAYEYARRGACLALVGRREGRLSIVARKAISLGCQDVITIPGDVSKVEQCRCFVGETLNYYGRLDHLVNNAGIAPVFMFEEANDIANLKQSMNTNFWGSAYATYFAIPHLKRSKGKIIVIASSASWLPLPQLSFYSASKAALVSFYETLRVEIGTQVVITIVTPGLIESEMTKGKFLLSHIEMEMDQELRDVVLSVMPILQTKKCAKSIVNSACRGDYYLTEPTWVKPTFYWKAFWPEALEWCNHTLLMPKPGDSDRDTTRKKIANFLSGIRPYLQPGTVMFPELRPIDEDGFYTW